MIEAFCEIVMQEVKPLALSPVIEPEDWAVIKQQAEYIAQKFGVSAYTELNLVSTDLAQDVDVINKVVVLYYKDPAVLDGYIKLKTKVDRLKAQNAYSAAEKRGASVAFRRLLGYSENAIARHYETKI
jgi:DNA gyrase/topoisomerase IV subunit A